MDTQHFTQKLSLTSALKVLCFAGLTATFANCSSSESPKGGTVDPVIITPTPTAPVDSGVGTGSQQKQDGKGSASQVDQKLAIQMDCAFQSQKGDVQVSLSREVRDGATSETLQIGHSSDVAEFAPAYEITQEAVTISATVASASAAAHPEYSLKLPGGALNTSDSSRRMESTLAVRDEGELKGNCQGRTWLNDSE